METTGRQIATLAGGCFWCLEAVFEQVEGIARVRSGYAGGRVPNPSYQQVCMETTGHAESVQVEFDPQTLSFMEVLDVFFSTHDPTTLNRQGPDTGTQYRSAIFFHTEEQKQTAEAVIHEVNGSGRWDGPIVTEVVPFEEFYPAEDYHQEYYRRNPYQPYCLAVISPKLAKFRKQHPERLQG